MYLSEFINIALAINADPVRILAEAIKSTEKEGVRCHGRPLITKEEINPYAKYQCATLQFQRQPAAPATDPQGDSWFIAKDACDILGIATNHLGESLDADEMNTLRITEEPPAIRTRPSSASLGCTS